MYGINLNFLWGQAFASHITPYSQVKNAIEEGDPRVHPGLVHLPSDSGIRVVEDGA
jgi:hypothetical protein